MIVEFINGEVVEDPTTIGPDQENQDVEAGFNIAWADKTEITLMQIVAQMHYNTNPELLKHELAPVEANWTPP